MKFPLILLKKRRKSLQKTYRLDLDSGRIIGTVDGIEAVNQAIRKAIITARYKCLIYDDDYGGELKDMSMMRYQLPTDRNSLARISQGRSFTGYTNTGCL